MATKTYSVISPLKFGGKKYPVGSTVELENAEAKALRVAEVIGDEVKPVKADPAK